MNQPNPETTAAIRAAAPPTPSVSDIVNSVLASIQDGPLSVNAMVDAARAALSLKPATEVKAKGVVEASDANTVNELLARREELKRIRGAAELEMKQLDEVMKEHMGDAETLTVHGAPVATYKRSVSRIIDSDYVKSMFPDIPGHEGFYKDSERRTFLVK